MGFIWLNLTGLQVSGTNSGNEDLQGFPNSSS